MACIESFPEIQAVEQLGVIQFSGTFFTSRDSKVSCPKDIRPEKLNYYGIVVPLVPLYSRHYGTGSLIVRTITASFSTTQIAF